MLVEDFNVIVVLWLIIFRSDFINTKNVRDGCLVNHSFCFWNGQAHFLVIVYYTNSYS